MLRASGVTGILRVDDVPLSAAAHAAIGHEPALMADAVTGGDDYEVLITLQPEKVADLKATAKKAGVPFSVIGEVKAGTEPLTVTYKGESFETASGSYSHF
jgi:thiamine-monophosphate kinase